MITDAFYLIIMTRRQYICIRLFLTFTFFLFFSSSAYAWLSEYGYRKQITVQADYIDSNLSGFPLYIYINADTGIGANMQDTTNYFDIRFTDTSDNILPYEEDTMTISGGSATGNYWVQVDLDTTSGATIFCYYGKAGAGDGSNATGVWDSNYKGVWHLPNGTSLTTNDSTSNNNDGSVVGTVSAASGQIDGAATIAVGDNNYISVAEDDTSLDLSNFTISVWAKPNTASPTSGSALVCKGAAGNEVYSLDAHPGQYRIYYYYGAWPNVQTAQAGPLTTNWTHVVGTYNDANLILYVNGSGVADTPTTSDMITNDHIVSIGSRQSGAGAYDFEFPGELDEVRISSVARSAAWIKFAYANMGGQADNELLWGSETGESNAPFFGCNF